MTPFIGAIKLLYADLVLCRLQEANARNLKKSNQFDRVTITNRALQTWHFQCIHL